MIIRKIILAIDGLRQRLERVEKRLSEAEYASRYARSVPGAVGGGGYAPPYAFAISPGSPGYGLPQYMLVEIASVVSTGLYAATPKQATGVGSFASDPDVASVNVWRPDMGELEIGSIVPARFEGIGGDGTLLYVVLPGGGGSSFVRVVQITGGTGTTYIGDTVDGGESLTITFTLANYDGSYRLYADDDLVMVAKIIDPVEGDYWVGFLSPWGVYK